MTAAARIRRPAPIPGRGEFWSWLLRDQRAVVLLAAFIALNDLAFIAVHIAGELVGSRNALLFVDTDRGYAEVFQYLKLAFVLLLVVVLAVERRSWRMLAWLPPFAYLLADDALRIHEDGGLIAAELLGLEAALGLRARDFGEIVVALAAGGACLVLLVVAYFFADRRERWLFRALTALVALLAVFGIGLDLVHQAVSGGATGLDWLAVAEDGGEMIVVTLMVVLLLRANLTGGAPALAAPEARPDAASEGDPA